MYERDIQKQIIAYLKSQGFKIYKISDRFRSGIPDVYACRQRSITSSYFHCESYWLEVKKPGEKPTKLQECEIKDLIFHGAIAAVVYSVEDVKKIITRGQHETITTAR